VFSVAKPKPFVLSVASVAKTFVFFVSFVAKSVVVLFVA
jgi:hypothetical protein